jgi:hypothetical protein
VPQVGQVSIAIRKKFDGSCGTFHHEAELSAIFRVFGRLSEVRSFPGFNSASAGHDVAELRAIAKSLRLKLDSAEREIQRLKEAAARSEKQITMFRQGKTSCEEFFNGWGMQTSPPILMALFGIAREASAATDCS